MSENKDSKQPVNKEATEKVIVSSSNDKLSMNYVLDQIEKIAAQTDLLNNAIEKLGQMADGDNADHMSPGNTLGQAKAEAIGDIVRCRETTNQQLLKLYEKMYDDLKSKDETKLDKTIAS